MFLGLRINIKLIKMLNYARLQITHIIIASNSFVDVEEMVSKMNFAPKTKKFK